VTVVDASVVVAGLVDSGPTGQWAVELLAAERVMAPHLLPAEVAQTLRRLVRERSVSADVAALALEDLSDLAIPLYEFDPYAERVWELRDAVTAYDAWYVALAESFGVGLATLDRKLSKAPGVRCEFRLPGLD
jgi:predicted nucleic acid-binding protein